MDQLFSVGKQIFKKRNKNEDNAESSGSKEGFNPLTMFKQLDKNGDGKITEEGKFLNFFFK